VQDTSLSELRTETVCWNDGLTSLVRDEWKALVTRVQAPVFCYPEWLELAAAAGVVKPYCILIILLGQRVIGIIPLRKRTRWSAEVCYPLADNIPAIIIDPQAEELAWQGFTQWYCRTENIGLLSLGRWPDTPFLEKMQQITRGAGLFSFTRKMLPDIWITFPNSWEEYFDSLGQSTRKNLQRRERQFTRDFGDDFSIELLTGANISSEIVEELIRQHRLRWHGQRGCHFDSPRNAAFYREVIRWAAGKGYLTMPILRLRGKPITLYTVFHIPGQDCAYGHIIVRDLTALPNNYSPGTVLMTHFFREAIARGIRHYSLGIGTPYYKTLFGGQEYPRSELFIGRSEQNATVLAKVDSAVQILRHLPFEICVRMQEYRQKREERASSE